ncbi:Chromosome partition protein Smc [bacterium HR37]|nr:Chromosome partition protein Smc [bacterium HR37]
MKDQITALSALQGIDLVLRELERNLENYPKEISRLKEELKNEKESIEKLKEELNQIKKHKNELESKLSHNQSSIKKAEKKLFEIKTYKEYEALQKEIAEIKKSNAELEEEILKEMENIESLEALIKEKEQGFSHKEKEYEKKINEYTKKIEELKVTYEAKKQERNKVASLINPSVLSVYERIRKRNGLAVVPARNEVCMGCNMNIPPQLFNEVLTLTKVIQCPNCHRILYVEEEIIHREAQTA